MAGGTLMLVALAGCAERRRTHPRGGWSLAGACLLVACNNAPDPWSEARSVCGFSDGEVLRWSALSGSNPGIWNDLGVPAGCADRLLADVGGDPTYLLQEIGESADLDEHVEAVRSGLLPLDGVTVLVWGLYWLVGGDYGDVSSVPDGPYADDTWRGFFLSEAESRDLTGDAPLSRIFYDVVATRTKDVRYAAEDSELGLAAQMDWWSGTLEVPQFFDPDLGWKVSPWEPDESAKGLVHEATHTTLEYHPHVECESPATLVGRHCDEDLSGAIGAGFYVASAEMGAATEGGGCLSGGDEVADALALHTEDRLRTDWGDSIIQELPSAHLADCR